MIIKKRKAISKLDGLRFGGPKRPYFELLKYFFIHKVNKVITFHNKYSVEIKALLLVFVISLINLLFKALSFEATNVRIENVLKAS